MNSDAEFEEAVEYLSQANKVSKDRIESSADVREVICDVESWIVIT